MIERESLRIRRLESDDAGRWDVFVEACPDATFFHRAAWEEIIREVFRHRTHFLLAETGGRIAGVLPLAEVRSRIFGHALTSLPFCVYGGAVGEAEAVARLEAEAVELGQRLGVRHVELRNVVPHRSDWPRQELYVTFRKRLESDDEANLLAIPRKQRAMVRKGISRGLQARLDPDVGRFFELYSDNVLRHGTPALPRRFFEKLQKSFGDQCEVMTVTDSSGRAVSSVLSFYFRDEVLPYYAGDAPAARELAANDFKYWALMQHAVGRGATLFDFGRSKRGTGSFSFKKNWGFEPQPLHYEYRLFHGDSIPQNNPLNPKYRAFIALWRRLPRPVANALGPLLVRSLG